MKWRLSYFYSFYKSVCIMFEKVMLSMGRLGGYELLGPSSFMMEGSIERFFLPAADRIVCIAMSHSNGASIYIYTVAG